jgi:hypothetical protein
MHNSLSGRIVCCLGALVAAGGFQFGLEAQQPSAGAPLPSAADRDVIKRYCVSCHNGRLKTGGLALDTVVAADVPENPEAWEKVVRKMRARQMPPVGLPRPDEADVPKARSGHSSSHSTARPQRTRIRAGRYAAGGSIELRYRNAIRDLLALDVDVASLLPADESSYGFDKVTVGDLLADFAGSLYFGGGEDQPLAVGRPGPCSRRRHDQDSAGPDSREHLMGSRSAHAAARSSDIPSPLDAEYELQIRLAPRSQRARRRADRAARNGVAARSRARAAVHRGAARAAGRISPRTINRPTTTSIGTSPSACR